MAKGTDNEMWNLSSPASQSLNDEGKQEPHQPIIVVCKVGFFKKNTIC